MGYDDEPRDENARMKDAVEADKMFTILMGESPALRRKFIEDNATLVKDLDI